ncbi:DUF6318 family protein [Ruania suaedae]|nr:DUF6318 family protein [Ruania suaedae]
MEEETVEGAIAAAEYFVELYPYVYASGDLEEWDALSDEGCGFCTNVRDRATELHADGGYAEGGEVEVYSSDGGGPYDGLYSVTLGVRTAESRHLQSDGSNASFEADDRPDFSLTMAWNRQQWSVMGVQVGEAAS